MGSPPLRIQFVYKDFSQFVKKDYDILSSFGRVWKIRSPFRKSLLSFLLIGCRQLITLLWRIRRTDAVYCWFADYHSYLPALFCRLTGKRFYLVLGGYDVTHLPEFKYGSFNKKFRGFCARYSMRRATLNLPVAKALGIEARLRAGEIRIRVLPTGYDPGQYLPSGKKNPVVLTVSITDSRQRFFIKGLDRFVELAGKMPEIAFVLIGMENKVAEELVPDCPDNLEIRPPVPHTELMERYGKAQFYAQFSRSEGLPNALCEAMLRNCIPLGLSTGGIPEAIGESGILIDDWDPDLLAEKIRTIPDPEKLSGLAREQIIRQYPHELRAQVLQEILLGTASD